MATHKQHERRDGNSCRPQILAEQHHGIHECLRIAGARPAPDGVARHKERFTGERDEADDNVAHHNADKQPHPQLAPPMRQEVVEEVQCRDEGERGDNHAPYCCCLLP